MEDQLYIVSVIRSGISYNGDTEFEARYSTTPDDVWGEDFAEQVPSVCPIENLIPYSDNINYRRKIIIGGEYEVSLAVENSCFSMQDCIDGILQLAWVKIADSYSGIPYGETIENSDMFFKMLNAELGELEIVNADTGNKEETEEEGGDGFDV